MAAAAAADDYPTIDPVSFDEVLCGTGLPEAVLAAACAAGGKTVLHVDPNPFYGSLSSSVPPLFLPSFLLDSSSSSSSAAAAANPSTTETTVVHGLQRRTPYSDFETSGTVPEPAGFTVDLVRGSNHVEFKSLDGGTLLYWDGELCPVPDSREAIFQLQDTKLNKCSDKKQQLLQKYYLNNFLKLVEAHIAATSVSCSDDGDKEEASAGKKISEEDLDLPFVEFLKKKHLPRKMIAVMLYATAVSDYDQDVSGFHEKLLTTRDGIKNVALYFNSIGRFANATGAFIYPMHGHGELPQAFCRFAAVKGALYVLQMPVTGLLMGKENQHYVGTRLASGQDIRCQQLILDASYKIPSLDLPSDASDSNPPRKVARGICILRRSVKPGLSNVLVVFPPKSLQEQQVATVRVLQLSSSVAICPPGMFIVYLSIPCADAFTGKLCINKAIEVLVHFQASNGSEGHLETASKDNEDVKPGLIWNCAYGTSGTVLSCPMPDESLDYRNMLESTKKLFADTYPDEEFLPRKSSPKYAECDSDSAE
ncbi:hypothetical protein BRADI_4g00510v3 [Brachypodium distachyon]|uniref:Rab proteins geranylgeranyltransferase component n=1 Tax=Brachypodium distachyon TaxID=15368 RepID=A0A0Q3HBY0_BRADI|nr:hypothetical protein BRADI_4g00510v3 [Brachypodium distachyon]